MSNGKAGKFSHSTGEAQTSSLATLGEPAFLSASTSTVLPEVHRKHRKGVNFMRHDHVYCVLYVWMLLCVLQIRHESSTIKQGLQ